MLLWVSAQDVVLFAPQLSLGFLHDQLQGRFCCHRLVEVDGGLVYEWVLHYI